MAKEQIQRDSFSFLNNAGVEPKQQKGFWQGDFYDTGLPLVGRQSHRKPSFRSLFNLGAVICASVAVLYLLLSCYRHLSVEVNPDAGPRRLATGGAPPSLFTCGGASPGVSEEEEKKEGGEEGGDSQVGRELPQQADGALDQPPDSAETAGPLISAAAAPPEKAPSGGATSAAASAALLSSEAQEGGEVTWAAWGMSGMSGRTGGMYGKLMVVNKVCSEGINSLGPEDMCNLIDVVVGLQAITLSTFSLAPNQHEPQRQVALQNTITLVESAVAALAQRVPGAHSHPFIQRLLSLQNLLYELRVPCPRPEGAAPRTYRAKFLTWFNLTELLIVMMTHVVNWLLLGRVIPGWVPERGRVEKSLAVLKNLLKTRLSQTLADSMAGGWLVRCQKKTREWVLFSREDYFKLSVRNTIPPLTAQRAQLEQAFADGGGKELLGFSSVVSAVAALETSPGGLGLQTQAQDPDITMRIEFTIHGDSHSEHLQSSGSGTGDAALVGSSVSIAGAGAAASSSVGGLPSDQASVATQPQPPSTASASESDKESAVQPTEGPIAPSILSGEQHQQALSPGTGAGTPDDEELDSQLERLLSFGPAWDDITDEDKD